MTSFKFLGKQPPHVVSGGWCSKCSRSFYECNCSRTHFEGALREAAGEISRITAVRPYKYKTVFGFLSELEKKMRVSLGALPFSLEKKSAVGSAQKKTSCTNCTWLNDCKEDGAIDQDTDLEKKAGACDDYLALGESLMHKYMAKKEAKKE